MPTEPLLIADLLATIEEAFPRTLQEEYDNSGLQVGDPLQPVRGVMLSVETTEAVLEECIAKGCNLLLSHHPILFRSLRQVSTYSYPERCVALALRNNIVIYAVHTSADNNPQCGVNHYFANQIGLSPEGRRPLLAIPSNPLMGGGMVGHLSTPLSPEELLVRLRTMIPAVQRIATSALPTGVIDRVALCGGSGGGASFLQAAIAARAQVYITGEVKYNDFLDVEDRLWLVSIGHYESERCAVEMFRNFLSDKYTNFALWQSEADVNPVHYF